MEKERATNKSRMGQGFAIGIPIGLAIGVAIDSIATGIAVGVAIGAGIGTVWDRQSRTKNGQSDNSEPGDESV